MPEDENVMVVEQRFLNADLEDIAQQDFEAEYADESDEDMADLLGY